MIRKALRTSLRIAGFVLASFLLVAITLILARAFSLRGGPDLKWWHTGIIKSEFRAEDRHKVTTFEQYLDNETAVFNELRVMEEDNKSSAYFRLNRYNEESQSYPVKDGRNFNRSAVYRPSIARGGVLLLHGMTDSPYSLRHLAEMLRQQGFYVLNLRLPGHGTLPAELDRIQWQDWYEAVKIGASHVAGQIETGQPFYLLGYSNGGTLALKYSMDAINDVAARIPDHVFLLSPMIGVDPLARFSNWITWVGYLDYFRQSRWLDIYPEYDPHKYNSFPMNAAVQSYELTMQLKDQVERMADDGRLEQMPPVLTFQSLVDSTVVSSAALDVLYEKLHANGSELVVFDANRVAVLDEFILPVNKKLLGRMMNEGSGNYAVSVVTNRTPDDLAVLELRQLAGLPGFSSRPLDYAWPDDVYSLTHVSLPFPPDDAVYGIEPSGIDTSYPKIGQVHVRGETGALILPPALLQRLRSNPFYGYVEGRIKEVINETP